MLSKEARLRKSLIKESETLTHNQFKCMLCDKGPQGRKIAAINVIFITFFSLDFINFMLSRKIVPNQRLA